MEQVLESIRRVEYVAAIRKRDLSSRRADPQDEMFDPIKSAILHKRKGDLDEAFWMVFLFVHFGQHSKTGWLLVRRVYGRLGASPRWCWPKVSEDATAFRSWLGDHEEELKRCKPSVGFGNHRKYQSLSAYSATGTGAAVESYVKWVESGGGHLGLVENAMSSPGVGPGEIFDSIFESMSEVVSFGRTARFDYLCMLGKLGLAPIEPGSAYIIGSTGPATGARLLFGGRRDSDLRSADLDRWLVELGRKLGVGMQVLEDALCNWQKSPRRFKPFRA